MTRYFGVVMCMSKSLVGYTFDWRQLRGLPMRKSGKKINKNNSKGRQ